MKQVLQNARTGEIGIVDVPAPALLPGCVLVRIAASLVSAGTERASSEFASKNLFQKAQARPDLVRDVVAKVQRDGLLSAVAAVRSRLDVPGALGYSSAGTVIGVGEGVTDLRVGDRVACAGAGYAVHAEFALIPKLLVAKIPAESVSLEEAAFTTVGAVALHGVRIAEAKVGEVIAVIGLGLLGQLTLQVLRAAGCRVVGMDLVPERAHLALRNGALAVSTSESAFRDLCQQQSAGRGVDVVVITAETPSSAPVNLAAELARDRGIVVAVGAVGMDIQRRAYYEKELDFRIARSYGPGRYDTAYEQKGRDYPMGYVRWTETRNMEAFLQLIADGKLTLGSLITHRFPIERAHGAYELINGKGTEPSLGVLITYEEDADESERVDLKSDSSPGAGANVAIGLLGTGAFATSTLLPALRQTGGLRLLGACGATGSKSRHVGDKFGFTYCTTNEHKLLADPKVNAIFIATRHHLHAGQACAGLRNGKHVFCEKPLCLHEDELAEIVRTYAEARIAGKPQLMVGFNRRFAPMAIRMKTFLQETAGPVALHYRVNAGYIASDHWVNDPEQGGGRLLGEVCHFIDFLCFLAGEPIEVQTRALANPGQYSGDNVVVSLAFASGSQGTITYVANGDRSFSKERLEVFGGGRVAVLEDFRRLELIGNGRKQRIHSRLRQDKGHGAEYTAFANAIRDAGASPIPFEAIVASTLATLRAAQSLASGTIVVIDTAKFIHSSLYPSS